MMLAASRPKDAVAAMIKRLSHRNANVQLYTLEVWSTAAQTYQFTDDGAS